MNLVGFVDFVLRLFLNGPYTDDSVANPFHITKFFLFVFNDGFHFPFGVAYVKYVGHCMLFSVDKLLAAYFEDFLNFTDAESLATPVIKQIVGLKSARIYLELFKESCDLLQKRLNLLPNFYVLNFKFYEGFTLNC